jgi:hypothetical protein
MLVRTSIVIVSALFPIAACPASLPSFDAKLACAIFHRDEDSEARGLYRDCLDSEQTAREKLAQTLSSLTEESVRSCTELVSKDGPPSYLALLGCIGQASKQPSTAKDEHASATLKRDPQPSPTPVDTGRRSDDGGGLAPGGVKPAPSAAIALKETPSQSRTAAGFQFTHDLGIGVIDPDVKELQVFLNAHGAQIAPEGSGSPGKEAEVFGPSTLAALIKFQEAHANDVLKPAGITKATGFFGATTRKYINELVGSTKVKSPE